MTPLLMALGAVALAGAAVWGAYRTWRRGFSAYDNGGFVAGIFGDNARYGYDAAVSTSAPMVLVGLALALPLAGWDAAGVEDGWQYWVFITLTRIAQVGILGGMALGLSLLLFLFPRFLVPPHLRDKRGWIPEWWHQWRTRRSGRRPNRGR